MTTRKDELLPSVVPPGDRIWEEYPSSSAWPGQPAVKTVVTPVLQPLCTLCWGGNEGERAGLLVSAGFEPHQRPLVTTLLWPPPQPHPGPSGSEDSIQDSSCDGNGEGAGSTAASALPGVASVGWEDGGLAFLAELAPSVSRAPLCSRGNSTACSRPRASSECSQCSSTAD